MAGNQPQGGMAVDAHDSRDGIKTATRRASLYAGLPARWQSGLGAIAIMLATAILIGGCALPGTNPGQGLATPTANSSSSSGGASALPQAPVNVIPAVQPSVVEVQSASANGSRAIGSGEIISSDGNIVTNDHVVQGFTSFQVLLSSGKTLPAKLVGEAPADDLAVLKVNARGLRPIKLGNSSTVQVGEFVLAIGAPLGSVTVPVIDAVTSCPQTFVPAASKTTATSSAYPIFLHIPITIF